MVRIIEVEVESLNDCKIIAPIISASLLLSHNIRKDTILILRPHGSKSRVLVVDGRTVKNLRPDYESMCGLIKSAIRKRTRYGIVLKENGVNYTAYILYNVTGKGLNIVDAIKHYGGKDSQALYIGTSTPVVKANNTVQVGFSYNYCTNQKIIIFNYLIDRIEQGIKP